MWRRDDASESGYFIVMWMREGKASSMLEMRCIVRKRMFLFYNYSLQLKLAAYLRYPVFLLLRQSKGVGSGLWIALLLGDKKRMRIREEASLGSIVGLSC